MCNICNMGGNRSGGCASTFQTTGNNCSCGCWNGTYQRICRDGCGNLIVRNTTGCNSCGCGCGCCHHSCCCNHACCCNPCGNTGNDNSTAGNNGNTGTNTNGVFRCVTFCGYGVGQANANQSNASQTNTPFGCNCAAAYYARQYGLTCDDNAECSYNFTND